MVRRVTPNVLSEFEIEWDRIHMQDTLNISKAELIKMRQDCIRMREALKRIAEQLDVSASCDLDIPGADAVLDRLPHIHRFALDMAEGGKRPGFDEFIREKLDAAASG